MFNLVSSSIGKLQLANQYITTYTGTCSDVGMVPLNKFDVRINKVRCAAIPRFELSVPEKKLDLR